MRTTVKAIAAHAGVNHGLVHHYFGSKEGLRAALVEEVSDNAIRTLIGEADTVPLQPPEGLPDGVINRISPDRIETFVRKQLMPQMVNHNRLILEILVLADQMPKVREKISKVLHSRRQLIGKLFGTQDPSLSTLMVGAMMGLNLQYKVDSSIDLGGSLTTLFRLVSREVKRNQNAELSVMK